MNSMSHHPSFEQLRTAHLKSLNINVYEYRHKKTGTTHIHLAADNPENVFLVGLKTIPTDSTGVAHILEHTVLCGSEKYPVRDPFFMMSRRSLNTFMNAFTSSDWTAYPFASQNRKDYFNLLDVYLDAVFFSRLEQLDFMQEGHRVEFEKADDPESDLVFKGVVFNEMKGAMSSASSVLWQTLSKHLFTNNTYHYNSGGEPEAIPDLSYEQLLSFYRTHYHPSNAIFMTYGDIPASELQQRFEDQVLQKFEPLDRTITVEKAYRNHSPIKVEEAYAIEEDPNQDQTHIVYGWLLGESIDLDERLRAHLLSSVLLDNSSSPLMQALEQTDLGSAPSPLCGVEDSALEMVFVCGLDGSRPERAEEVEQLLFKVLNDVAENGVPKEQVEAVLHQLELSQREIRGDGMPFGLQLVLSGLSPALQRGDAIAAIDLDPALERLREAAEDEQFIPRLVKEMLLDNPHQVRLTLRPDGKISDRRVAAEKARLKTMKAKLSSTEAEHIVAQTEALAQRQLLQDDPNILPKVTLADVPADMNIPVGQKGTIAGAPAVNYSRGTNGLVYQHIITPMPQLEDELLPYVSMYTDFMVELGSANRSYLESQALQAQVTGGLGAYTMHRGSRENEQDVSGFMVLRGKALLRNTDALSQLMHETLFDVRFDEQARIRELISQSRLAREQQVTSMGSMHAMLAAASGMSPVAHASHQQHGLEGLAQLKALDKALSDPKEMDSLCDKLLRIKQVMLASPRQFMVVAEDEHIATLSDSLNRTFKAGDSGAFTAYQPPAIREQAKQLWSTSTEVNFCAKAFATVPSAHEDAPALSVLGPFLRNGYLHRAIRETGGAYGGGASYHSDSASFRFYSYRDPRLNETLEDFDRSIAWLQQEKHDARQLEEAILNVVSGIDKPGSPVGEARSAYHSELFGRTPELRQQFRQAILQVTLDDLKRVGERYFDPNEASTAVVTNAAKAASEEVKALKLDLHVL